MAKPKLTPAVLEAFKLRLQTGATAEGAAASIGIHKATFYRWLQRGDAANTGIFRDFCDAIHEVQGDLEARCALVIRESALGKKDPTTGKVLVEPTVADAKWMLTHGPARDRWSPAQTVRHTGKDDASPIQGAIKHVMEWDLGGDPGEDDLPEPGDTTAAVPPDPDTPE